MANRSSFFCFLWLSAATPALAAQQPDSVRTTLQGVYTTSQAQRGAAVFKEACAGCHATARFQDSTFLMGWSGRSVRDLFESIRTQMPIDNPGGLRRQEYADVLAYLFERNGLPPGNTPLPTDDGALRRLRVERKPSTP